MVDTLKMDGERYLPWMPIVNWDTIHYDHLGRYYFARYFASNKAVLDLSSGEGFGTALLAQTAKNVLGVDISTEVIEFSKNKYIKDNLKFIQGNGSNIPIDGTKIFDLISSFETIEHIVEKEQILMIEEFERLLKDDGLLIISTPNYEYTHDILKYENPYHKKELTLNEFDLLLSGKFPYRIYFGQRNYYQNQIARIKKDEGYYKESFLMAGGEAFIETDLSDKIPQNYICIASKTKTNYDLTAFMLTDLSNALINALYARNAELQKGIDEKQLQLSNIELQQEKLQVLLLDTKNQLDLKQTKLTDTYNQLLLTNDIVIKTQAQLIDIQKRLEQSQTRNEELNLNYELIKEQQKNSNAHIKSLQTILSNSQIQLDEAKKQLMEKQTKVEIIYENYISLQSDLNVANKLILSLQNDLKNILQSFSWKITKPLRIIRDLFNKH